MSQKCIRSSKDNLLEYAYISVFEPPVPSLDLAVSMAWSFKSQHVQDPAYVTRNVLVRIISQTGNTNL
jgi:hypothetical protein